MAGVQEQEPNLVALLGPTNTGKTHRAVERMQRWRTGMLGLPLRLLAREVYDRVSVSAGESRVALVTGEEKRIPADPSYWVCTVEAMPLDREVEFMAVDEIQLAVHEERGHVFTDRLLNARGTRETWLLGSGTMRRLVERLLPAVQVREHPRFSNLRSTGSCKLGLLPPRSAIVAFSATQVYEISERVRKKKGGAAVVLGSLSPRTRNAQVALYQAGEVDYIVATDAIGMGLNLDIDHVAFAGVRKFDGRESRCLEPAELAQIAGRAGRYLNDGTFGSLAPLPAFPDEINRSVESHRFPSVRQVFWRNSDLDMTSLDSLIASLCQSSGRPQLRRVRRADDFDALCHLAGLPEISKRVKGPDSVRLLWEVCQIPDYGGHAVEQHARLLLEVFGQLAGRLASLDESWIESNLRRLDEIDGGIEALMMRIELVRTWTYVSHHARWVKNARYWQERAVAVEQRLSDALHEALMARFVDRSGKSLLRSRRQARTPAVDTQAAPVAIDGPFSSLVTMRHLFRQKVEPSAPGTGEEWVSGLLEAPHDAIGMDERGYIRYGERLVGRLARGSDLLHPEVRLEGSELLGAGAQLQVRRRLVAWARDLANDALAPLGRQAGRDLTPAARGLLYQLEHGLGTVPAALARDQLRCLTREDRRALRLLTVVLGRRVVYVGALLDETRIRRRAVLCAVYLKRKEHLLPPEQGLASIEVAREVEELTYLNLGFVVFGPLAIRADLVERLDRRLYRLALPGAFEFPAEVTSWLRCSEQALRSVVPAFGYRLDAGGRYVKRRSRRQRPRW